MFSETTKASFQSIQAAFFATTLDALYKTEDPLIGLSGSYSLYWDTKPMKTLNLLSNCGMNMDV